MDVLALVGAKVRPGITGPRQEAGRSDLGFKEMVQHDIAPNQSGSIRDDLVTLAMTQPAALRGRGAR